MKYLFFDLATTSGNRNRAEIISIGAICKKNKRYRKFEVYIEPDCGQIHPNISMKNNYTMFRGELCYYTSKEPVEGEVYSPYVGIGKFIKFVKSMQNFESETVTMIAHNGIHFDSHILCRNMAESGLDGCFPLEHFEFRDSLQMARDKFFQLDGGYSMDNLCETFLDDYEHRDTYQEPITKAVNCSKVVSEMAHDEDDWESIGEFVLGRSDSENFADLLEQFL